MNKLTKYIRSAAAFLAAVVGLAACTGDPLAEPQPGSADSILFNPDGTLGITLRMEFPGMSNALTRALDETPGYESLNLYMLVFEQGEGLKQYARPVPDEPNPDADSKHNHAGLTTFSLALEPTEKPVTIHLIATDQPDFDQQIGYGTEERVISSLYTDQEHEAYWQRRVFEFNIPSLEQTDPQNSKYNAEALAHARAIREALSHVPMIRNFCRVSVENLTGGNFLLTGVYVVNTVDRGSVAPYVAAYHRFVDYYDEPASDPGPYTGKSYADITAQGHIGSLPIGVQLINKADGEIRTKSEAVVDRANNSLTTPTRPVYFYERPARVNSTERTYVILRGYRPGIDSEDSYYKVDLGHIRGGDDPVGLFDYYNLLRNFDYSIRLHTVGERGYGTLQEAAKGAVFNNFSAAVEARNMTSISDGDDMIFVKFREIGSDEDILSTTFVFTQPNEKIRLLSQYRIRLTEVLNGEVHNELIRAKFDPNEGDPGVIISPIQTIVEDTTPGADSEKAWNEYVITGGEPTDLLRQQSVYIYRGNKAQEGQPADYGLYRVVTFFSHNPWPFVHIDTFSGLWEDVTQIPSWDPDIWSDEKREIGQLKDSPLTLFFELPPDLPQAIFPLDFVIESDRQNIQNAYKGNAVVRAVPAKESLFYDPQATSGNPTTTRIQYVKTVTWDEYYNGQSDEQVGTGSPIVRCRFLTITDLAQEGIGDKDGTSTTLLRVSNRYFGRLVDGKWQMYHEDGFVRSTKTSDPSPRSWDFNSAYWDDIMFEMNQYRTKKSTTTQTLPDTFNASADELTFKEGVLIASGSNYTGSMSNAREKLLVDGIEEAGLRYVLLTNNNDALTHTHTYPQKTPRTIRLEVVSTDNDGISAPPRIEFTGLAGGTMSAPAGPTDATQQTDDGKTIFVYEIDVPEDITALTLNIKAPTGTKMRFYKIDFNPRWDEYVTN